MSDEQTLASAELPGGVAAIYGKWPGDETDEEIDEVLKSLDPPMVRASDLSAATATITQLTERVKELERERRIPTVEDIEDAVGMGHGAWDTINPQEIIDAVLKLSHKRENA